MMSWVVYILRVSGNQYYTGITNNLANRLATHASGKGSKYVRSRLPFKLVYTEEYDSKSSALRRELEIKKLSHSDKEMLIKENKDE